MATGEAALRVNGLRELQASLKAIDGESQKQLRLVLNEAAAVVVKIAKPRTPTLTGAARDSIRVASTQRTAQVRGGSARVPYFGWLDYGGNVGRGRHSGGRNGSGSIHRTFIKGGRIVYPAYYSQKANIDKLLAQRLDELIEAHGLKVT
jgi:hypothetical protein